MKTIDLGKLISILANVGVIAGIMFLAIELHQNNELLRNEARYNLLQNRAGELDELAHMPELGELWARARDGAELSAIDRDRLGRIVLARFIRWEWYYEQYRSGLIDAENLPVEAWRAILQWPAFLEIWNETSKLLTPDFVDFIEKNVIG